MSGGAVVMKRVTRAATLVLLLAAVDGCGRTPPLSPPPPGPGTVETVSVRFEGLVLDGDRDTPVAGAVVRVAQLASAGVFGHVALPESAISDGNGAFDLSTDLPTDWGYVVLVAESGGYLAGTRSVHKGADTTTVIKLIPPLTIRPGETLQARVLSYVTCFLEDWPCRPVLVESPTGVLVDVEVIPAESDAQVGLEAPITGLFPTLNRRVTVSGGDVWLYGDRDKAVTVTAVLH
jgi:hypothetical protein